MTIKTMRIVSGVLSAVGAAGVIGTSYLAVKEAPKTKEAMSKLGENPTFWQKAKTFVKGYKWTLAAGSLTIGSNITSAAMQAKMVASLSASVAGLTAIVNNSEKFKQKAKDVIGKDNYNKIVKAISKDEAEKLPQEKLKNIEEGKSLYWEEHVGFVLASENDIRRAQDALNHRLNKQLDSDMWTFSLEEFFDAAGAEYLNKDLPRKYKEFGWGVEHLQKIKGCQYVDIDEELLTTDALDENGNTYRIISWDYPPVYDPLHFEDAMRDDTEVKGYLLATPEEFREKMEEELEYGGRGTTRE